MDLLPTFCALAGAKTPDDRTLDGYDLSKVLLDETEVSPRDRVFYWRDEELFAVRVGPWKAHFITQGCYGIGPQKTVHDPPELYNLDHDPSEKYNIAELHPDAIERLQAIAQKHRESIESVENQLTRR